MKRIRRVILPVIACSILLNSLVGCNSVPSDKPFKLTVVHVNDTHSHLFPFTTPDNAHDRGGFARLATVIKEVRAEGNPVLLLHGGDSVSGSPSEYLVNGKPNYQVIPTYGWRGIEVVDIMNRLGFDAAVMGNHEMDYGRYWLERLMGRARYPILSANVIRRDMPDVDGMNGKPLGKPYVIVDKGGLRIGVIGLTTVDYIMTPQVQVQDPMKTLQALVPEVDRQCDFVILLSHAGYKPDLDMALKVPGVDLIVGGHTHTLVKEPVAVGQTLVVQDGQFAEQVGILDLVITGGKIASYQYRMTPLDPSVAADPETDARIRGYLAIGSVGDKPLAAVKFQRSDLSSLATSAMLASVKADAAMIAADSLSGELGPGSPSVQQFFDVFWPYHSRNLSPEKDMSERQLLSSLAEKPSVALRTMIRASDGLRTLATVKVPARKLTEWLAANEGRKGDYEYVQADWRDPQEAAAAAAADRVRTLVMPMDLVMRLGQLGLEIDPKQVEVGKIELFEAVLDRLGPRP